MKLARVIISEGSMYPPWYYGFTESNIYIDEIEYHVIPLNYIVRLGRFIRRLWIILIQRPKVPDIFILDALVKDNPLTAKQRCRLIHWYESRISDLGSS
ncbi:hypothetical protein LCGC14_1085100 [marine sediment metagenome]|uniref:Uncharacterized protein n=1 Tax=marine sediment metagenome TaxID=412755 RepID=A0A0F9N1P2_9ZZZZ